MYKLVLALIAAALIAGCGKGDANKVVATVDGKNITMAELDKQAEGQIKKLEAEVFNIKQQTLNMMIEEKILESAAKKAGVTVEEYLKNELESKIVQPSEDEMKKLYEQHKGPGTKPFEELKPQIEMYIKRQQAAQLEGELIAKLKKEANVKTYLEAPRVKVSGTENAPFIGPKDAKVTVVEFSDYQCPFCGRQRPVVWELVENKYKDKIKYVFMDFPLSFHKDSQKAHEAAHCAGDQNKYFDYNKKLFASQSNLSVDALKGYAKEMGLDMTKFDECLDKGKYEKTVKDSIQSGVDAGVNGTPAFFINGIAISGAQPVEAFVEIIDTELNK